jgi:hypothetical protein
MKIDCLRCKTLMFSPHVCGNSHCSIIFFLDVYYFTFNEYDFTALIDRRESSHKVYGSILD